MSHAGDSGSSRSANDTSAHSFFSDDMLQMQGYHFSTPISGSDTGESNDFARGYRIADRKPVVAKFSSNSLKLEREYHTMRRLYQQPDGPKFIVQALERITLRTGVTVIISADEGPSRFERHRLHSEDPLKSNDARSFSTSTTASDFVSKEPSSLSTSVVIHPTPSMSNTQQYDLATFLRFAIKCTDCLEFIHRNNTVHGELRSSSFYWSEEDEGKVKIASFGQGARSFESYLTSEGWRKNFSSKDGLAKLRNTLTYLSPEQTGRTTYVPDHRADLYSLGVIFFVLLACKEPFEGGPLDILNGILSRSLTPIHELRPDVPVIITMIIEKMTAKSPDARYSSAIGIREDLKECLRRLSAGTDSYEAITSFPLAQHDVASIFTLPSILFGRQNEIQQISSAIRRVAGCYNRKRPGRDRDKSIVTATATESSNFASDPIPSNASMVESFSDTSSGRGGHPYYERSSPSHESIAGESDCSGSTGRHFTSKKPSSVLLAITGPSGVGKSALFNAVQTTARHYGFLATAKFDSRNQVPFACIARCISQILRQIMSESSDANVLNAVKETLESQYVNIRKLLEWVPELAFALNDIDDDDNSGMADISVNDNRAELHFVFVQLIRALALHKMITLFLDDLHQADQPSLDLLFALIAAKTRILFIVSFREEAVNDKITQIMDLDKSAFQHIHVDNLDIPSLTEFICQTLHRTVERDAESVKPLVELIYRQTRGNPFYTCQLLRAFAGKENLIFFNWDENQWDFDEAGIEQYITSGEEDGFDADVDVSYLVARLRELPSDAQRFLRYASFIGNVFSWNAISYLMSSNVEDVSTSDEDEQKTQTSTLHPLMKLAHTYDENHNTRRTHLSKKRGAINGLQTALQEGLIVPLDKDEFRWSHDRYSQAAMAMVSPSIREQIHYKLAMYYLQNPESDSVIVADHLLHCADRIRSCPNRPQYRAILLKAGQKQQNSGAHTCAMGNINAALQLLDDDPWKASTYNETLQLYTMAVGLSWVVGDNPDTETYLDVIFEHVTEPLERLPAYRIKGKYYYTKGMHDEAFNTLFACLSEFGISKVNANLERKDLDDLYFSVKDTLTKIGLEEVGKLGKCVAIDKSRHQSVLSILEETLNIAYWLGNQTLMFYLAAKIVELSVRGGIVPGTCVAFQYLGLAAVEFYKQYSYGHELGATGLAIADRIGGNSEKGRAKHTYASFLAIWKYHLKDTIAIQESGVRYSSAAGDRIYTSYGLLQIATCKFFSGVNLWDVLQAAEACYHEVHTWSPSIDTNILIMSILRTVKALQGKTYTDDPKCIFDGDDGFNDAHFINEICLHSFNPAVPMNWYESFKLLPLVLYGHSEEAVLIGDQCHFEIHNHPCQRHTRFMMFLHSLAIIDIIRQSTNLDGRKRLQYLTKVQQNQRLLNEWVQNSRVNFEVWYTLVEAETVSLQDNFVKASKLYEKAMDLARDGHWMLEKCITHEYAGEFYLRNGIANVGVALLHKAVKAYTAHGSYGKAQQLSKKHHSVFVLLEEDEPKEVNAGVQTDVVPLLGHRDSWGELSVNNMPTTVSPNPPTAFIFNEPEATDTVTAVTAEQALATLDIVDLSSILKSSQVISSEVKFDSLLQSMMTIILDNSAAECGAIIVKDEYFGICAFGTRHGGPSTFDPPKPLREEEDMISNRIVQHTLHTCESTLIPNVQNDPRFAVGSWFERAGIKSIICLPVLHKGVLAGCLYLEGSPGIFTQRHITVLTLLCQQMGISLTNAFLFKSIQKVTMTNVRMIETQKQALEEARKSKEDALRATHLREIFLANMSHEIRTPFSGFYGMISLLSETHLDAEQQDLVRTAKESCEMLLRIIDDLLNFSKLQAAKVTLDISRIVLEDVIADVVEILIAMAARKNLTVVYFVDDDVPPCVMADGNRLRQVLMNLVGNAIKFTDKGEVVVRCSRSKHVPQEKGNVVLLFEVIDSGIGISESQLKALFKPFSQVDGSTTRVYGGTGLGLSICMQLVQLMSGKISVTSTPGIGSNFFFNIQVQTADDPAHENMEMEVREDMKGLVKALGRPRVLIGSASKSMLHMMRGFMSSFEIVNAESFVAVKTELMNAPYDILILDFPITAELAQEVLLIESSNQWQNLSIIVLHYPSGDVLHLHQEKSTLSNVSTKLIRMAIPVRRLKLLRAISDLLNCAPTKKTAKTIKMTSVSQIYNTQELELFKSVRILIAEDNPVAQKLLFKQLTRLGFNVDCANNGLEAVGLWESHPETYYAVALFDHHMPVCDGVEATKRIRKQEKINNCKRELPIIALTADVQQTARDICSVAGMNGYLTKPLNQNSLAELLRQYLIDEPSSAYVSATIDN